LSTEPSVCIRKLIFNRLRSRNAGAALFACTRSWNSD